MIEQSNANSDDPKVRSSLISLIVKYYLTQFKKKMKIISHENHTYIFIWYEKENEWDIDRVFFSGLVVFNFSFFGFCI